MHATVYNNPDLAYPVNAISEYMANPKKKHYKVVQWIFRYLSGSTSSCLHIRSDFGGSMGMWI